MCGIVGLFAKAPDVELRLGELLGAMLAQLGLTRTDLDL